MRVIAMMLALIVTGCAGQPWCVPVNDLICRTPMQMAEKTYAEGNCFAARLNWAREAKKGNAAAQNNMGLLWEKGCVATGLPPELSIAQDYGEAYRWYMLAATNGDGTAVFNLGRYHENGLGVEKDIAKAAQWYSLAARKGNDAARLRLSALGQPIPTADLVGKPIASVPSTQPTLWRELGEWVVAFAGAFVLASARDYQEPARAAVTSVQFRANCRTRVLGDVIKTECY